MKLPGLQRRHPVHPLRRWRVLEATALIGGCFVLWLAASWAFDDTRTQVATSSEHTDGSAEDGPDGAPVRDVIDVDPSAFDVALWNPPNPPPPPPPATPPVREVAQRVPPLNVQLLAIVRSPVDGTLAAMLYDPRTDTLYTIGAGEEILGHTVAAVKDDSVMFKAASTETRLSLMPEDRQ